MKKYFLGSILGVMVVYSIGSTYLLYKGVINSVRRS